MRGRPPRREQRRVFIDFSARDVGLCMSAVMVVIIVLRNIDSSSRKLSRRELQCRERTARVCSPDTLSLQLNDPAPPPRPPPRGPVSSYCTPTSVNIILISFSKLTSVMLGYYSLCCNELCYAISQW